MVITIVNVDSELRDQLIELGCDIIRDAPDTGLDVQVDTSKFTIRISSSIVSDGCVRLRNKELGHSCLLYDVEFRSIDVR